MAAPWRSRPCRHALWQGRSAVGAQEEEHQPDDEAGRAADHAPAGDRPHLLVHLADHRPGDRPQRQVQEEARPVPPRAQEISMPARLAARAASSRVFNPIQGLFYGTLVLALTSL